MVLAARCKICGRIIEYTREDPGVLGDHILEFHPNTSVTHFSCLTTDDSDLPSRQRSNNNKPTKEPNHSKPQREVSLQEETMSTVSNKRNKANSPVYKTTVETWKSGSKPVYCPKCDKDVIPTVRRQRNKISRTSCGAFMLMGCWPLCFLPFVMNCCNCCGQRKRNLYCPHCCTYLGTYDRKNRLIKLDSEKKSVSMP